MTCMQHYDKACQTCCTCELSILGFVFMVLQAAEVVLVILVAEGVPQTVLPAALPALPSSTGLSTACA